MQTLMIVFILYVKKTIGGALAALGFLIVFILAGGIINWLLKQYFKAKENVTEVTPLNLFISFLIYGCVFVGIIWLLFEMFS